MEDSIKSRIYFYTKADKQNGFGHLTRQLLLYKKFKKKKFKCYFLKDGIDKKLTRKFKFNFSKYTLKNLLKNKNNKDKIFLIIDRYDIDDLLQREIKKNKIRFLLFDNIKSLKSKYIYSDIVVNIDPSVEKKIYLKRSKNKNIKILNGFKYSILKEKVIKNKNKIYDYLVSFGGSCNQNLYKNFLNEFQKRIKEKKILVILGFSNSKIKLKIINRNKIILKKMVNNMQKSMMLSKNIVCAGGTTLLESLRYKIKRNVLVIAKNQKSISDYYLKKKYISNIGYFYLKKKISDNFFDKIINDKKFEVKIIKSKNKGSDLIFNEILRFHKNES